MTDAQTFLATPALEDEVVRPGLDPSCVCKDASRKLLAGRRVL
ncbi:hypothetical protein ACFFYR_38875 [Paraburkholderia dipogonis]